MQIITLARKYQQDIFLKESYSAMMKMLLNLIDSTQDKANGLLAPGLVNYALEVFNEHYFAPHCLRSHLQKIPTDFNEHSKEISEYIHTITGSIKSRLNIVYNIYSKLLEIGNVRKKEKPIKKEYTKQLRKAASEGMYELFNLSSCLSNIIDYNKFKPLENEIGQTINQLHKI